MTDLSTLMGKNYGIAYDINNTGQIVGTAGAPGGYHAFLYDNGQMTDLDTLGGELSAARGINEAGQIVGISTIPGGQNRAFLDTLDPAPFALTASSNPTPLPTTLLLFGSGLLGLLALGRRHRLPRTTSSLITNRPQDILGGKASLALISSPAQEAQGHQTGAQQEDAGGQGDRRRLIACQSQKSRIAACRLQKREWLVGRIQLYHLAGRQIQLVL
jgi:probable HAF family extracellular repeat protein